MGWWNWPRPFAVHCCHHMFVTHLYEKTADLYLVQRALGHRQITTTEIFVRVSDDRLRRAVGMGELLCCAA